MFVAGAPRTVEGITQPAVSPDEPVVDVAQDKSYWQPVPAGRKAKGFWFCIACLTVNDQLTCMTLPTSDNVNVCSLFAIKWVNVYVTDGIRVAAQISFF